jgi:AraC family transcriptional activator of pobA
MSKKSTPIEYQDNPSLFNIRRILREINPAVHPEPPHRHNFQELIWIRAGRGSHRIDDQVIAIQPHTFYLIAMGQVHFFDEGLDLDGLVIRFDDAFLLDQPVMPGWDYRFSLFSHFRVHSGLTVPETAGERFHRSLLRIEREFKQDGFGQQTVLRHLLSVLLIELERTRRADPEPQPAVSTDAVLYQHFIELLEAHYRERHDVDFYADRSHVAPRRLTQALRVFSGKSTKGLIRQRLMLEACRYLTHTNTSVQEIAYILGFRDPSYFSRAFKAEIGVSPNEYQRKGAETRRDTERPQHN